jgi:signal transduction histidine kinase
MAQPAITERIISMNIRRLDGTVVYSRWKELIGSRPAPSDYFRRAAEGDIAAEFDEDPDEFDARERAIAPHLVEFYAPVREAGSGRVIAVAEFYASGERVRSDVRREIALSWLIVALVTIFMIIALWSIVTKGGRVIADQRYQLKAQIANLRMLLAQNEDLRVRLQRSNATAAEATEQFLRRIGADLHDGPAQLLSYTLLRLHKLAPAVEQGGSVKERGDLQLIRDAVRDSLREIRDISQGMGLPELEPISLAEVIKMAIGLHERLTNTFVSSDFDGLPEDVPKALKICIYRFVQEGLTNAFRHAGGIGQCVTARATHEIEVKVLDRGPGLAAEESLQERLGLAGLRARIEGVGGNLTICSESGKGTSLVACFDLPRIRHEKVIVS